MKNPLIFLLFLFLLLPPIYAQDYYFRHMKVEEGVSHNTITSMIQDHRGFMWFGTKDGLNRFDGYKFRIYRHQPDVKKSIGSNFIRTLHEFQNYIWVGTDNGLYKFNEQLEEFDLVKSSTDQPILDITNDQQGNLWFIAAGKLYKIPVGVKGESAKKYKTPYLQYVMTSKNGTLWASSQDQLFRYSEQSDLFELVKVEFQSKDDLPFIITALHPYTSSTILLGTKHHGAFWYDPLSNDFQAILPVDQNPLYVRDMVVKGQNELWIATESGLFIFDIAEGDFQNLKKSYSNAYALSDNALYCLTIDQEGGVWIGTYFGGINYLSPPFTPFKKYFPQVGENSISGNAVREIHEDQYGNLWIGTEDAGLNRFDPVKEKFFRIPSRELSHYNIHGILPIEDELWVGTFEHGIDILDINTGKRIRHFDSENTGGELKSDFILDIFQSASGRLYILTSLGIHEYLKKEESFITVSGFPSTHHYSFIEEDSNGTLWAGTYWDGLFYFNPRTGKKGKFKHDIENKRSISSNVINGIFRDSGGNLWITTENGLNLYNPETADFTRFTTEEGLPSNVTYSILEDESKDLWISTSSGIARFNPGTGKIKSFSSANGLLTDQFNYSSAYKDQNGTMYFGSVSGMIRFKPDSFTSNCYQAPILLTQMQVNNEDVEVNVKNSPLSRSINSMDKIELDHTQSSFSLEFANLTYTAPRMTEYWYRMLGLHDNWIYLGKDHKVYFTELPAGEYTLQVKSKNAHGNFGKEPINLAITVLPPIWLSKWAYLIYWLLGLLLFIFLLRWYHRHTRNKNKRRFEAFQIQQEKEIYKAKIQFFTNVAHEIKTPLSLIRGPLEKLLRSSLDTSEARENVEIMERNTSRLLDLVNQLLDFRKTESKSVKLTFVEVDIIRLIKETWLRFKPAFEEKGMKFVLNSELDSLPIFADEEAVNKILSNLFNNALKYGESRLTVSVTEMEKNVILKIENDGKIIPSSLSRKIFKPFFRIKNDTYQPGTGIGLSLAHSLTLLHGGELYLEKNCTLNTFVLNLPIHQENEFQLHPFQHNLKAEGNYSPRATDFSQEKPNLLIAEDNEDLLRFLQSEFRHQFTVIQAKNGMEALNLIKEYNIHLIITDVSMPKMDGSTLCHKIKTNLKTSHIPVVLLTAKSALQSRIEGLETGADAFISKPFSIDYLKAQVNTLLRNRKNVLDYFASSPLSHIKSIAHSSLDTEFLNNLETVISENISNTDLNVDVLAATMNMSRSTLYRKIKDLSNLSPNELINITRLKQAAELLATGDYRIFEVAEKVGYKSQNSLGRNFQKQFKMTPTDYIKSSRSQAI